MLRLQHTNANVTITLSLEEPTKIDTHKIYLLVLIQQLMKKAIIIFILVVVAFGSGYLFLGKKIKIPNFFQHPNSTNQSQSNNLNHKNSNNNDEAEKKSNIEQNRHFNCQPPLISSNNGCCLDSDNDGNCDQNDDLDPCGDGICQADEVNSCCLDCGCPDHKVCSENECLSKFEFSDSNKFEDIIKPKLHLNFCGDGICSSKEKTDGDCCSDCGCPVGSFCGTDNKCSIFKIPPKIIKPPLLFGQNNQPKIENWIVVILDKIKVRNSGDNKDPGELMFFSIARNGSKKQTVKWPLGGEKAIWRNQTLLGGKLEAVPLFAMPEKQMSGNLDLTMLFGESDLPSVIPYLNSDLDAKKVKYLFSYDSCQKSSHRPVWVKLLTETIFKPFMLLTNLINKKDCRDNDFFGEIHRIFSPPNWQIGEHKVDLRDITVFYEIKRIAVDPSKTMSLKLSQVKIINDGDRGDNKGEIVGWGRFATDFKADSFGAGVQFANHKQKIFDLGQHKLNGPADLGANLSKANYSVVAQPFIYAELDLFDRDSDCLNNKIDNQKIPYSCYQTNKLEEVGITSLLFFQDTKEGTYSINSGGVGEANTTWEFHTNH